AGQQAAAAQIGGVGLHLLSPSWVGLLGGGGVELHAGAAPLGEAAAEPEHLAVTGLDRSGGSLEALPALGAVAGEDQRGVLVGAELGGVELVERGVEVGVLRALLLVGDQDGAGHVAGAEFLL